MAKRCVGCFVDHVVRSACDANQNAIRRPHWKWSTAAHHIDICCRLSNASAKGLVSAQEDYRIGPFEDPFEPNDDRGAV